MSKADKKKYTGLFDAAFERALFENAVVIFDDLFQEREVKEQFVRFCEVYHRALLRRAAKARRNGKNGH